MASFLLLNIITKTWYANQFKGRESDEQFLKLSRIFKNRGGIRFNKNNSYDLRAKTGMVFILSDILTAC